MISDKCVKSSHFNSYSHDLEIHMKAKDFPMQGFNFTRICWIGQQKAPSLYFCVIHHYTIDYMTFLANKISLTVCRLKCLLKWLEVFNSLNIFKTSIKLNLMLSRIILSRPNSEDVMIEKALSKRHETRFEYSWLEIICWTLRVWSRANK